jgi:hypothetical protein
VARQIIVDILGDASKFNSATKSATTSAGKFGNVLQGIGQGIGISSFKSIAGVAEMASSAIVDFVGDSIQAASNLNEEISKTGVVFGKNAGAIEDWAATAAKEFGQSKRAALEVAGTFAGLFQTVGLSLDDATDKSKKLTELGSDLASFFNTDVKQATEALRSGLSGESEPLRKFNVFLSEAAVAAKAAELGLKGMNGKLTEGEKVQARYAIILDQTAKAQGDFARTSDGVANQQRTLQARLEDTEAAFGQRLLPVVAQAQQAFIDLFDVIDDISKGTPPATDAIESLGDNLVSRLPFIGQGVGLFKDLGDKITDAGRNALGMESDFDRAAASVVGDSIDADRAMRDVGESSTDMADTVQRSAEDVAKEFKSMVDDLVGEARRAIDGVYDPLIEKEQLMADQVEIQALRQIAAKRKLTAEERLQLFQAQKSVAEHLLELAKAGATNSKAYSKGIADLKTAIANAKGPAKAALQEMLNKILAVQAAANKGATFVVKAFASGSGWMGGARAKGGPVKARKMYLVNEDTPKSEYFAPDSFGQILTHAQGQAAMSGGGGMSAATGGSAAPTIVINIDSFIGSDRDIDRFADRVAMRLRIA